MSANGEKEKNTENTQLEIEEEPEENNNKVVVSSDDANCESKMGFGSKDEWCGTIVKYSMFLSNFVIFIGGIVLVAISVYTLYDKSFIKELLGTNLFTGAVYILIVAGILLSLLSFLGCAGAVKEVKCMLLTYFIILFIIFIVMLVGGILCYMFRQRVQTTMQQEMLRTIRFYGDDRAITRAWDDLQEGLHCCGVTGYDDWRQHRIGGIIPSSCCQEINGKKQPCNLSFQASLQIYNTGCLNVTTAFMKDHATTVGTVGIAVSLFLLFGLAFSCALFMMIV
ncbi:CD151 antigen isoform X1 [Rhopalosiphum maidis]|uniref:CD151 antigen isoform X1 n=1 Tax=Rhopalosiphum maidis TaxID=43146 RepID=UPI000F001020|nr:CD151 antigen isoform X1 [Rhopalosiphum maidis]